MLKKTLKNRLIFSIIFFILLFGFLASVTVFVYARNVLIENKKNDLLSLNIEQAHETSQIFANAENIAKTLSGKKELKAYFSGTMPFQDSAVLDLLEHYLIEQNNLAVYILDTKGTTRVSTDTRFVGQDYSFREYFKKAVAGEPAIEVNIGVTSKELGFYFSFPVQKDSQIVGVAVIKLNPQIVNDSIALNVLEGGTIMFADSNGVIVYAKGKERQYRSLGVLSPAAQKRVADSRKFPNVDILSLTYNNVQQKIERGDSMGIVDFFDIADKEEEIVSFAKVAKYPFYIIIEQTKDKFVAQAARVASLIVLFIILGAVGCSIVIILLVSNAFQPLAQLKKVAQLISVGNFRQKVDIRTGDELEELGKATNIMIENLRESYANLEKKVNAKTSELAEQLQTLSEKNKILNDTQRALINVMEDIQEERDVSQSLANDLMKFQLAVENASDHIIIADPDGKILYGNNAAEKITGYSLEEMRGKTPALWGKQMPQEFYKKFWQTIKYNKQPFAGEINNKRKNGEIYVAEVHVVPILKDNGEVQFFVGIERDVTKAKEVDKAKTEFVSLASHQLRTPLTAISWYIEMLIGGKAGKLKVEQKKYLEEVYKGNLRMRDLVNALLNVSRIDMGSFIIEPEKIDIVEMIENLLQEMESVVNKKKIKVTRKLDDLPQDYLADPKLLRIVLQNILSNAVKYTPDKGSVRIEARKNKSDFVISVQDTGYGIPKNQQEKIFEKFFRADNARIKDPEGTGLGLYIVKSILGFVDGKIWFESEENKGSRFFISLPLKGMQKKAGQKGLV